MILDRIVAIDPGRGKCGLAVMDRQRGVLQQSVTDCSQVLSKVRDWAVCYKCSTLVIGDGTAARPIQQQLASLVRENVVRQIVLENEKNSTREARQRYWLAHPPSGWRKFIPIGLLTPPCAIDDFAAIILGERYFAKNL